MRQRLLIAITLLSLTFALPALADERAPSPRERVAKIVRVIKKIFTPAPQDAGDMSWPKP
jgi:hypothetical protein